MTSELEKLRIHKDQKASRHHAPRWPWVALVLVLAGVGAAVVELRGGSSAVTVQTMRIHIPEGAVSDKDLVALNATGYITAAHKIELASKVIGRVAGVEVEMGDKVAKDQVLVRLEDDEYKARVAQMQGQLDAARARLAELEAGSRVEEIGEAAADVDQARASLANAESNYTRLKELEPERLLSKQELDNADTLVRTRKAELDSRQQRLAMIKAGPRKEQIAAQAASVRQLEATLHQATLDLNYTIIRSPITGTILARNVEVGEFVTNGFVGDRGAKGYVVSLADLNDLRVELDVSQNDFAKVEPKQTCWITTDAYPDRKYQGIVDLISPEANRQKATVQVRVKVLNPDDLLKPDMNSTVSFLSTKKLATTQANSNMPAADRPVLRIPSTAVRDGNVFLVESGKAVRHAVTAGAKKDNDIEIHNGLIGGEDLIINPPVTLKDGDAVKVEEGKK